MSKSNATEREYQKELDKRIKARFGHMCELLVTDPQRLQGVPDRVLLCKTAQGAPYWTYLETKRKPSASKRPNQGFYISKNGFFINPENEEEVLDEIAKQIS